MAAVSIHLNPIIQDHLLPLYCNLMSYNECVSFLYSLLNFTDLIHETRGEHISVQTVRKTIPTIVALNWMWQFTQEWFYKWFTQKFILLVFHEWGPVLLLEKCSFIFLRSHTGAKCEICPLFLVTIWSLTSVGSSKQAWRPRQLLSLSQIPPSPNCYPCGPAPPAGGPLPDPGGAITQICWAGLGAGFQLTEQSEDRLDAVHFCTNRPVYLCHIIWCSNAFFIHPILVFAWQNNMSCADSFRIFATCHWSLVKVDISISIWFSGIPYGLKMRSCFHVAIGHWVAVESCWLGCLESF